MTTPPDPATKGLEIARESVRSSPGDRAPSPLRWAGSKTPSVGGRVLGQPPAKAANQPVMCDVERVKGIEPSYEAWEAAVLPLNYTRNRRHSSRRVAQAAPLARGSPLDG